MTELDEQFQVGDVVRLKYRLNSRYQGGQEHTVSCVGKGGIPYVGISDETRAGWLPEHFTLVLRPSQLPASPSTSPDAKAGWKAGDWGFYANNRTQVLGVRADGQVDLMHHGDDNGASIKGPGLATQSGMRQHWRPLTPEAPSQADKEEPCCECGWVDCRCADTVAARQRMTRAERIKAGLERDPYREHTDRGTNAEMLEHERLDRLNTDNRPEAEAARLRNIAALKAEMQLTSKERRARLGKHDARERDLGQSWSTASWEEG